MSELARIEAVLDEFHAAASVAAVDRYFAVLAPDAVFLGTAAEERWARSEYREVVSSYFTRGKGWTYVPRERFVTVAEDGRTAWFDELLDNASYGECRGSGVLQLRDGSWLVEQYNLTIPVPNEIAMEVVERIRSLPPRDPG